MTDQHADDLDRAADGDGHGVAAEDELGDDGRDASASDNDDSRGHAARTGALRRVLPASLGGRLTAAAAVLLAVVLSVSAMVWRPWNSLPDNAAFVVGDEMVTRDELDQRMDTLHALYGVEEPDDPDERDEFRRDAAKSVAVSMILDDAVAEHDIEIPGKRTRDVLDRHITEEFDGGGRDDFVRALGNVGASESEVLDEVERQLAIGRLMENVLGEVEISDERLRAEFDERADELAAPQRRTLRNIVVESERDARDVLDRLDDGESFETVAEEVSLDGSTKDSGGMLEQVSKDQLETPVAEASFDVDTSELYGPVEGETGWHVGRVDEIFPSAPADFAEISGELRELVQAEVALERWREWLAERIRRADVRYADEYRPADPNAAPEASEPGSEGLAGTSGPGE
ncbi:peptidyl-prolyl cis-trans isomerase C [Haloechinothrix alba]|uniref:Peptidyl-prolyl cis-trans isomerase C n=1 Tax=Haloechinothrix alba TaxID=664784 RepID=A0A238ZM03_9PSEU|nr:peptidyl-prolyl cis-trans isomerase [Haloechinothrix alba]SNR84091.1 peptidyl-prolyl cis-trans isomerase C [Haloechinothrix alba]